MATSYVTMPFPSPTEAQVAHQCLATQGQPQVGAVRKEFTVFGNVLIMLVPNGSLVGGGVRSLGPIS